MGGVKWIRIDTQMFENPKLLYLKEDGKYRAIVIHLEAMAYSGRHGLCGYLPRACLRILGATARDAKTLVESALWDPAPGGWQIHGWDEYQLSAEDMQKRRERAQKGAAGRWGKRNGQVVDLDA